MRLNASVACGLAAYLVTTVFLVRNLSTWPTRISYPGEESYEGLALAEMIHIRQGVPTYSVSTERYDDATYGPLYYLAVGRLVNLVSPSYFPLRVLSVIGIIGCAAACALLAFWLSGSYLACILSPMVFLSYGMVSSNGIQALSDSVALLLALSGFLVAYKFQRSLSILLALPLMVLSFYYKPQYVAGPIAVLLFLLFERRYRLAVEFGACGAVCAFGLFSVFQWVVFRNQAFWLHFLLTQNTLLTWQRFEKGLFVFSFMLLLPIIFAVEYLRTNPNRMLSLYLLVAVALGLLTYSKDGSGVHYFFETVLLVSILIPVLLVNQIASRRYPIHLVFVLAIMLLAGQWSTKRAPQPSDFEKHDAMQAFLQQNFPLNSKALGVNPGGLLQAGFETPFAGLFTFAQLARRGVLSDRDLSLQISAHRFAVVVLSFDLSSERDPYWLNFYLTPATRNAINRDYILLCSLGMPYPEKQRDRDRYYIYVPRHSELNQN